MTSRTNKSAPRERGARILQMFRRTKKSKDGKGHGKGAVSDPRVKVYVYSTEGRVRFSQGANDGNSVVYARDEGNAFFDDIFGAGAYYVEREKGQDV